MNPRQERLDAVRRLYALECLRFPVGRSAWRTALHGAAVVAVVGIVAAAALTLGAVLGVAAPGTVAGTAARVLRAALGAWQWGLAVTAGGVAAAVPGIYVGASIWREWSEDTAIWWLALPEAASLRLAAKCARGLALGWRASLVVGSTFVVQAVMIHWLQPTIVEPGGGGAARVLAFVLRMGGLSLLGVAAAATVAVWGLWLGQLPKGTAGHRTRSNWLFGLSATAAGVAMAPLFGGPPGLQALAWIAFTAGAGVGWSWACGCVRQSLQAPGQGREAHWGP